MSAGIKWNRIDCELLTNTLGLHLNDISFVTEDLSFPVTGANRRSIQALDPIVNSSAQIDFIMLPFPHLFLIRPHNQSQCPCIALR